MPSMDAKSSWLIMQDTVPSGPVSSELGARWAADATSETSISKIISAVSTRAACHTQTRPQTYADRVSCPCASPQGQPWRLTVNRRLTKSTFIVYRGYVTGTRTTFRANASSVRHSYWLRPLSCIPSSSYRYRYEFQGTAYKDLIRMSERGSEGGVGLSGP